eukprot:TRINITY_DN2324_c0_g1_i1.p1 TRINITY_DN2324_c0_g1~~TRINITY_DN2324_c0_g1_i1.p1  ORF type:complete len:745 (-),score=254.66 TRINITY_DN2324_c0_g1_i1:43-2277(-)
MATAHQGSAVNLGVLSFRCESQSPLDWILEDDDFKAKYGKIRTTFSALTTEEVLKEAYQVGLDEDVKYAVPHENFETNCAAALFECEGKLSAANRINMLSGCMMPTDLGTPLYQNVSFWRALLVDKLDDYQACPKIALWDIACNLAVERCQAEYSALMSSATFNPEFRQRNISTLLSGVPCGDSEAVVYGIQGCPRQGTPDYDVLAAECKKRNLKQMIAGGVGSVGFLYSRGLQMQSSTYAPLGDDAVTILKAMSMEESAVDEAQKELLLAASRRTLVLDLAAGDNGRPMLRLLNVCLAAEGAPMAAARPESCPALVAKYLRAIAGASLPDGCLAVLLVDVGRLAAEAASSLEKELRAASYDVLSPGGKYITTRKQRSDFYGRMWDRCQAVEAGQSVFQALLPARQLGDWKIASDSVAFPLIGTGGPNLPNKDWPSDHACLFARLVEEGLLDLQAMLDAEAAPPVTSRPSTPRVKVTAPAQEEAPVADDNALKEVSALKEQLEALRRELEDARQQAQKEKSSKEALAKELEDTRQRAQADKGSTEALAKELEALNKQLEDSRQRAQKDKGSTEALVKELEEARRQSRTERTNKEALAKELEDTRQRSQTDQGGTEALVKALEEARRQSSTERTSKEAAEESLKQLKKRVQDMGQDCLVAKDELWKTQNERTAIKEDLRRVQQERDQLREEVLGPLQGVKARTYAPRAPQGSERTNSGGSGSLPQAVLLGPPLCLLAVLLVIGMR